ncbi:MFS transporter [Actinocorallia libanotica]|uniref:MFS transporter n=1 Tax=Actinocorallia libanotica TaxID=46162 RepID=UPI0031D7F726
MADRLGADFNRLWLAYTASTAGSAVATHAFSLIAVLVLSSSALQVSLLSALGGMLGAFLALPLGPWIEFRRKRPVMIGADVLRCAALLTIPLAYACHALTYAHLLAVCVLVAVGQIAFAGASGAHLKALVPPGRLTEANARFESVMWTSSAAGPPAGGLLIALLGPAVTMLVDAAGYLLSALGIRAITTPEPPPPAPSPGRRRWREIGSGWRSIRGDDVLRPLFANTVAFGALNVAITPVLAVLMLRDLHFTAFQYGLSVGVPCVAGILGARLSRRLSHRDPREILLVTGVARVLWLPWLPFVGTGWTGLVAITAIHTGTVFFTSAFTPVFATCRLERTPREHLSRVLTAWSITANAARAVCTLLWGLLATLTTPRLALAAGSVLLLASCAALPWKPRTSGTPVEQPRAQGFQDGSRPASPNARSNTDASAGTGTSGPNT